ncbi:hypothetical protein ACFYVR_26235 [Rhodococcus sp. NPDC003318]|uniref:hypothetical protein n=1 Tax=Rhodococcus sp. NPDC003318 TaxID=3364503 RepID=UPI0036763DCE
MTEDEIQRIAELHFDSDPAALAELRRDPGSATVLDALTESSQTWFGCAPSQSPPPSPSPVASDVVA